MRDWTTAEEDLVAAGRMAEPPVKYSVIASQINAQGGELASTESVRHCWRRNKDDYEAGRRQIGDVPPPAQEAPPEVEVELESVLHDYRVVGDHYVFSINDKVYDIHKDRMELICQDYTDFGGGLTRAELAREHGLPLPIVISILGAYKLYKASVPFTREKVKEYAERGELDALADEAVEVHEHALHRKIQHKQVSRLRSRVLQLEDEEFHRKRFMEVVADALEDITIEAPAIIGLDPLVPAAHVPTEDEHVGKYVYAKESFGANYDTDLACLRIKRHADLSRPILEEARPKIVYRTFLGDFWHALTGQTEHGTKLDQDTRAARVWAMGLEAAVYSVNAMRGIGEAVHVYGAPGNHDGFHFWQMLHSMQQAFEMAGVKDVVVHADPMKYVAFRVAETLHVLDHGYGYSNPEGWKTKAAAEVVAREVGGEDFFRSKYIYTYIGDKHSEARGTLGRHHKIFRLPSLGESDDYETQLRYATDPEAHVLLLDGKGRVKSDVALFADELRVEEE